MTLTFHGALLSTRWEGGLKVCDPPNNSDLWHWPGLSLCLIIQSSAPLWYSFCLSLYHVGASLATLLPWWLSLVKNLAVWKTQVGSLSWEDSPGEGNGHSIPYPWDFPGSSGGKESACNVEDGGLIPGSGRPPGDGKLYRLGPVPSGSDPWRSPPCSRAPLKFLLFLMDQDLLDLLDLLVCSSLILNMYITLISTYSLCWQTLARQLWDLSPPPSIRLELSISHHPTKSQPSQVRVENYSASFPY